MQISLWNTLNVLFVCCLIIVCVINFSVQHSDGLVKLQSIDFPFSLARFSLKTFTCLTVWPPIISWRFLLLLNAIIGVVWNTPWNLVFICKIFQFLFTILDMLRSVLLYVIESGNLFLLFFFFTCEQLFSFKSIVFPWFAHLEVLLHIVRVETSV